MPGMTPMVQRIMIACGVIWLLQLLLGRGGIDLDKYFAVGVSGVFSDLYVWQPFTYMWLHDPHSPWHLVLNMFSLWMFGGQLEMAWGSRRFLRFYLICGTGAGAIIVAWNWLSSVTGPTLGASGAIFGVLTAFSLMWPDRTIMLLFPPIPMRAIWFIPFLFAIQLAMGGQENVSTIGHLGGVIVAAILLRDDVKKVLGFRTLKYRWHRMRMRNRLRAVRRDEVERRARSDDDRPTMH